MKDNQGNISDLSEEHCFSTEIGNAWNTNQAIWSNGGDFTFFRWKKSLDLSNVEKVLFATTATSPEYSRQYVYNLYVNGDGTNTYIRDMETGKPKIYVAPDPTQEELKVKALAELENEYNLQKEGFKKDLDTATLAGNTEAVQSIQKEFMEFNKAYEEAKNNILEEGVE